MWQSAVVILQKEARMKLEVETGKKVVSPLNAKNIFSIENKTENRERDTIE